MNHIYNILQYLSIDVAIGSVGSSILAVKVLNAKLPPLYWVILPLCVWIIYTLDHLLDSWKVKEKAFMMRHRFHFMNRRSIIPILSIAVVVSGLLALFHLDRSIIIFGSLLSALILIYLLLNQFSNRIFNYFPRELLVTVGYIAGTWGVPFMSKYPVISRYALFFCVIHFLIILSIPLIYSYFEYKADIAGKFISYSTVFGLRTAEISVFAILIISFVSSLMIFIMNHLSLSLVLTIMSLYLVVVFFFRKSFIIKQRYRGMSDAVNFIPFFLLI